MHDPAALPSVRSARFEGVAFPDGGRAVPYSFELLVDADGGWETAMTVGAGATLRGGGVGGYAADFFRGVLNALPDSGSRAGRQGG